MIILSNYGIKLVQLSKEKIELVRHWRNSEKIRKYMEFRENITPEMQQTWFERISTTTNDFFFLIEYRKADVGLINIKNIDWNKRCGESGIFIWDDSCLHTGVSYRAALCQRDFAFNVLHLDYLTAHILNTNIRSIKYKVKFGFELSKAAYKESNEEENQLYILTKESYSKNKYKVMELLNEKYPITPHYTFNLIIYNYVICEYSDSMNSHAELYNNKISA